MEANTISVYWDNFYQPVFNGELNATTALSAQGACVIQDPVTNVTLLQLCLNIYKNDQVQWVTLGSVPTSGFGIQATDPTYRKPIFQWENLLLPFFMTGEQWSVTGTTTTTSFTFYDAGTFYYRDVNHTNPYAGAMFGVINVSNSTGKQTVFSYFNLLTVINFLLCSSSIWRRVNCKPIQ